MCVTGSLVFTCGDRADLLALLYVMFSCDFVTFQYGALGQVWYLVILIPYLCFFPYFHLLLISMSQDPFSLLHVVC